MLFLNLLGINSSTIVLTLLQLSSKKNPITRPITNVPIYDIVLVIELIKSCGSEDDILDANTSNLPNSFFSTLSILIVLELRLFKTLSIQFFIFEIIFGKLSTNSIV